ncbi:hypothetical protein AVEN_5169-1 [Araneus ventricosus]|uniref:Uncharacterized protein n=1 Tax=Araneus ventricosus TaxID=182803 RepID=A0A4Y2HTV9_ARAVE|nr:hypothetical protein AVEN_5169-1 [Araneus ventricosus]
MKDRPVSVTSKIQQPDSHHKTKEMKSQKVKKILDMLGIDLSQIDLSQIDVTHKFDGKDSLQPSLCHDTYNDRYGVGKHFVRGVRDVGFAIVSGAEGLIDGLLADLPLVPNIASGIGGGLKAVICAIEDGFSDIGSDLDSALDIAKNGRKLLFDINNCLV